MAWIMKRKGSKRGWWSVYWRNHEGRQKSKSLKTTDRRVAEMERLRIEREVEHQENAPRVTGAGEALGLFLGELEHRARLRPPSVQVYRERLEPLFEEFHPLVMARWTRPMLKTYLARRPEWSARTIQLTVNACRRFVAWCREDACIDCPDFVGRNRGLVPEVRQKTDHEVYSLREVVVLASQVRGVPWGNRWIDLAVHLAFWAALPLGDIRTLEWKHIDLEAGTLKKRRQKTGEMIAVPIAHPLRSALVRHRRISGLVVPFFPQSGTSARKSLIVKIHNAGLAKRPKGQGGWHLLRHSAASAMDAAGARESSIRLILGHKAGTMTGRYIHARLEQAREDMQRLEVAYREERRKILQPRLEQRQARRAAG